MTKNILSDFLVHEFSKAVAEDAWGYTQAIRKEAATAGWSALLAMQLSVVLKDGAFTVEYPKALEESIKIKEYGTDLVPPSPVIRNFLRSIPTQREIVV